MSLSTAPPAVFTSDPTPPRSIRWGQITTGGIALALIAGFGVLIVRSQSVQWAEIPHYLVHPSILSGVVLTLQLTFGAMLFGIVLGCLVAVMATSDNFVLKAIAAGFVWWFRGVPLIVQVFFWFNIALFVPQVGFGAHTISINDLVTPALAGFLALGLHEAANMAEIVRGGLQSIGRGQRDAAAALGMKPSHAFFAVVLPQALRLVVPPTGNQAIGMLKASAIVSVIGMQDLLTQAQHIYARTFLVIELLFVASIWYLALTTIASLGQHWLETRLAPKDRSSGATTKAAPRAA